MNELNSKHFICTGNCHGVADKPGVCQTKDCVKHNHPLELCDCKDGKHNGRQWTEEEGRSQAGTEAAE